MEDMFYSDIEADMIVVIISDIEVSKMSNKLMDIEPNRIVVITQTLKSTRLR